MALIYKNVFYPTELRVFAEIRKILYLEKLQSMMKKKIEQKYNFSIVKGIITKFGGQKICRF